MSRRRPSNHPEHADEPQSSERDRPPRVIVAVRDAEIRSHIASALRADGYMVIEASSGFELLDHISTSLLVGDAADKPDAIIMGLWMPGISGHSILGGLRDAKWPTPILLVTGPLGRQLRETYRRLGANAIFEKPFDIDDLRTVMLNLVPGATRRSDNHKTLPITNDAYAKAG